MIKRQYTIDEGWNKGITWDRIITDVTDTSPFKYILDTISVQKFIGLLIRRNTTSLIDLQLYLQDSETEYKFVFLNKTGTGNQWSDTQLVSYNDIYILPNLSLVLEINPIEPDWLIWIIWSKSIF